jgi:hypothetical protein
MSSDLISRRRALATGAALTLGLQAQDPPLPTTRCRFYKSDSAEPLPPNHRAWKKAEAVVFDQAWNGSAHFPERVTNVKTLWNQKYMYLLFDCRYVRLDVVPNPDLTKDQPIYERDCAEFFAAPNPENLKEYKEFEYSPAGEWFDARINNPGSRIKVDVAWNTGMKVLARIDESAKRWWSAVTIPIDQIAVPKPRDKWRVNFYRIEGPRPEPRTYMAWSATMTPHANFHVPLRFGWMEFVK